MDSHDLKPDPPLNAEQVRQVAALTSKEIALIDATILGNATPSYRKVARVVATAMIELEKEMPHYAQRIKKLVDDKRLEAQGDLSNMRYSEVRLPKYETSDTAT